MTEQVLRAWHIPRQRLVLVLAIIGYVTVFNATYRDVITPIFSFWGLGYREIPSLYFWTTAVLCVVPSFWMPVTFTRPSLLLFYMQYLVIYIPAAFLVFHSTRPELPLGFAMQIVCSMFIGLSCIQLTYVVPIRAYAFPRLSPGAFWVFFVTISVTMLVYIAVTLSANFRIASFNDVNAVRYAMADIVATTGSRFGVYSQFLLLALFLPMLFAVSVYGRRWWLTGVVGVTYIFIFGIGGAKQAALSLVYLPMVYALLSRSKRRIPVLFIAGLAFALLLGYFTNAVFSRKVSVAFLAVVHFRLLTVPALTIPQYAAFFQTHPLTHMSHVTGFNWLLEFPYEKDVAYTIGRYYYHTVLGANSGLWASDGIGAFGIWGIPFISCVCAIVFWVFDSISADMDPSFVGVLLAYCAVSFTNVSIFTTLITGGLAFVAAALIVAPRDERGQIMVPSLARSPTRYGLARQVE